MEEQVAIAINNKHCEKCNKTFNSNAHYLIHCETEIHKTGQRKIRSDKKEELKCTICNIYSTKQKSTMKLHILNNHSTKETKKSNFKFYCECCDYGIINEKKYNEHLETTKHKIKTAETIN
jgi:hypothetical protein